MDQELLSTLDPTWEVSPLPNNASCFEVQAKLDSIAWAVHGVSPTNRNLKKWYQNNQTLIKQNLTDFWKIHRVQDCLVNFFNPDHWDYILPLRDLAHIDFNNFNEDAKNRIFNLHHDLRVIVADARPHMLTCQEALDATFDRYFEHMFDKCYDQKMLNYLGDLRSKSQHLSSPSKTR